MLMTLLWLMMWTKEKWNKVKTKSNLVLVEMNSHKHSWNNDILSFHKLCSFDLFTILRDLQSNKIVLLGTPHSNIFLFTWIECKFDVIFSFVYRSEYGAVRVVLYGFFGYLLTQLTRVRSFHSFHTTFRISRQ
jgi:hypothetical protein